MQFNKAKIVIVLIGCFLGASIITFLLKRNGNLVLRDTPMDRAGKLELQEGTEQKQLHKQSTEASNTIKVVSKGQSDDIKDLEALSGDLIKGDIGDIMDMQWSSREITSDFSDRNKLAEVVSRLPVSSNVAVSEEQLDMLRNCVTEMIFNNGNNDYESYLRFLRESGETVDQSHHKKVIPGDPWKLCAEEMKRNKYMSMWKGLVCEGSEITIFESQTSEIPLGEDLYRLRGAIRTFGRLTAPPISLDEILKIKGKVLMADVQVFIAHDDSTGGVVWPYIIRYWFDPINNSWRVQRAALFGNRHKAYRIVILP